MNIEELRKQVAQNPNNFPLAEAIEGIAAMPEEDRWAILRQEYQRGAEAVCEGSPVLYYLVDRTEWGRDHMLRAVYYPGLHALAVEIPAENLSGRLATMLHATEVVSVVNQMADNSLQPPSLQCRPAGEIDRIVAEMRRAEIALIPLMLHPENTNAVVFDQQARRLYPQVIVQSYWEKVGQLGMEEDLMRHTMLVTAKWPYPGLGPESKAAMNIHALPHKDFGPRYSLVNIGRIKSWDSPDLPGSYHVSLRNSLPGHNNQPSAEDLARRNAYAAHG